MRGHVLRRKGTEKDLYFSAVSLLLHGDGANNGTVFTDNSPNPKTISAVGGAVTSTAQSLFGGSSILVGTSGGYLSGDDPNHTDFKLGTEDCCIEAAIYITDYTTQAEETYWPIIHRGAIWSTESHGNTQAYSFMYSPQHGNRLRFVHRNNSGGYTEGVHFFNKLSTVLNLSPGVWYRVAAVRTGNSIKLFLDGADVTDDSSGNYSWGSFNFSAATSEYKFLIGAMQGGGTASPITWLSRGYIDELRITKGAARYTAAYTPAANAFPNS